jgi:hypothetical protein
MKRTQCFFVTLFAVMLYASCASTHKVTTTTSSHSYDTTVTVRDDTAIVHAEHKDSIAMVITDSITTSSKATEMATNDETIIERIVETTDTMGRKVMTTDRTINRKGTTKKETSDTESLRHQQEQTAITLSMLDSIAGVYFANYNTHWVQNDSTHQEKDTERSGTLSLWDRACNYLGWIIFGATVIGIFVFAWKTKD